MILKYPCNPESDNAGDYDYQYFGKDAEEFLKSIDWKDDVKYLGKECTTFDDDKGIIIGVEDSNTFMDYYFIVYLPDKEKVIYELVNSSEFVNNIKI